MGERILCVDDESNMLKLLKTILKDRTSYEVDTTNNSLEAGRLLEEKPYDVLITDLKMPGLDGMELLASVKQKDENALILVITAFGSLESTEEAMTKAAFDYIIKPFRKE